MKNYKELIEDILENGTVKSDRTGTGTISVFGRQLRWNMQVGFPLMTVRKIPFRIAVEEMMFFLRGDTQTKKLEDKNINIWVGNTTREFLDERGLNYLPEGDMGKGYGWQMRNFGGKTKEDGYDQIKELLFNLKRNPDSRRHIVTHWNPLQLDESALPPCHMFQQWYVANNNLSLMVYMRSWDIYHGAPFNISGYGFVLQLFAEYLGYGVDSLVFTSGDTHLYNHQLEVANELIERWETKEIPPLPILKFKKDISKLSFEELLNIQFEDIELIGYNPLPPLKKVKMAV